MNPNPKIKGDEGIYNDTYIHIHIHIHTYIHIRVVYIVGCIKTPTFPLFFWWNFHIHLTTLLWVYGLRSTWDPMRPPSCMTSSSSSVAWEIRPGEKFANESWDSLIFTIIYIYMYIGDRQWRWCYFMIMHIYMIIYDYIYLYICTLYNITFGLFKAGFFLIRGWLCNLQP